MPIIWKTQKTVETSQEQLWTVPRILKFQETVRDRSFSFRVRKTVCVRQVQDMDMIVDFLLLLQHQVQTIQTVQRQRRFLSASSLIVEDLPEMGQRQDQTEKIQKTVAKTQGQIAQTFSDHPEEPAVCQGTTVVQRLSRSP